MKRLLVWLALLLCASANAAQYGVPGWLSPSSLFPSVGDAVVAWYQSFGSGFSCTEDHWQTRDGGGTTVWTSCAGDIEVQQWDDNNGFMPVPFSGAVSGVGSTLGGGSSTPPDGTSTAVICAGSCTVTHVVTVEGLKLTATEVQDLVDLFYLFLVAAVAVLCGKAIYNRFRVDYDH